MRAGLRPYVSASRPQAMELQNRPAIIPEAMKPNPTYTQSADCQVPHTRIEKYHCIYDMI